MAEVFLNNLEPRHFRKYQLNKSGESPRVRRYSDGDRSRRDQENTSFEDYKSFILSEIQRHKAGPLSFDNALGMICEMKDEEVAVRREGTIDQEDQTGCSAILIHKDAKGFEYEKQQCNGKKNQGYEYVAVRYKKLELPVYCCYVENDRKHISHNAAALALEGLTRGIGAGDFNINSLLQFHKIFSNLKDCMDETMATHQDSKTFSKPSKIDYVFVVKNIAKSPAEESSEQDGDATKKVQQLSIEERNKNFYIRVHKPLCPDLMYVEAHYPIVFDISNVPFNDHAKACYLANLSKTDCDDPTCNVACNRRTVGFCPDAEARRKKKLEAQKKKQEKERKKQEGIAKKEAEKRAKEEKKNQERERKKAEKKAQGKQGGGRAKK
ncbi:hypothetical protein PRIPAC_94920 [Pristionchus pacificus]|uniref:Uncharacterized protein n=1 Tax=Pristionchus pacificus TaxID=54126 RepID=A0A2A6CD92_PRIPA|nr:hypothetical protein PRIPAC_94920 [Pristionchus pacificus]|eukprot:PDM76205.1 hypothetical protein PRIPAC_39809 [Pristionchus pacificus]